MCRANGNVWKKKMVENCCETRRGGCFPSTQGICGLTKGVALFFSDKDGRRVKKRKKLNYPNHK